MKHKTLRCTAETVALLLTVAMLAFLVAGLHQHDHGHGQTGNQLDNRQNQFQSSHGIHPFMIGKIIYYNGVTISQHLVHCKRCFAKNIVFLIVRYADHCVSFEK